MIKNESCNQRGKEARVEVEGEVVGEKGKVLVNLSRIYSKRVHAVGGCSETAPQDNEVTIAHFLLS